jgi:hypothetical protein
MKLIRRIKSQIRKQWLFSKPLQWPQYVHNLLKKGLKANNYKFLENEETNFITYDIGLRGNGAAKFDFYQDAGTYVIRCVINVFIPEIKMRDAMIMVSHLNNRLQFNNVYVHPESNSVVLISKIDLASVVAFPDELFNLICQAENDCAFCFETFEKLINSDEDPIFIIAEVIERMKKNNSNQENNQA